MAFPSDTTRLAQGAEIEGSLTVARPVNTIVRDVATGELFVSTNAALAAYNQLTGTFSPTTFAGIGTTGYVPDPAAGTATRILSSDGNWGEPVVGGAAGGDLAGTYPNPSVVDLTMAGEAQGDVLINDGANWIVLPAGVAGQVLQTQGAGADPLWVAVGATDELVKVSADDTTAGFLEPKIGVTAPLQKAEGSPGANETLDLTIAVATTATTGVVELATDGEVAASVVVQGNDGRLSDARTPTGAAGGDLTGTYPNPTVATNAVGNSKLADVATATIKGRVTALTGDPEDLSGTQATTLLDSFTSALQGVVPGSGGGTANFLRADGTWAAPPGGGTDELVGVSVNDTTPGYLLGKLTTATTGVAWTEINDGGDEDLRLDVDSATAGGPGLIELATQGEVDTGTDTTRAIVPATLAGSTLASDVTANNAKVSNATHTGDVTGATALTIAANAVTNAMLAQVATDTLKGRTTAGTGDPEDLTATQARTVLNVEDGADVTDAANVAAAGAVMETLADAKGDLFAATADDVITRLPVGADTFVLTADSVEATGVKWAAGGGGGTAVYADYYGSGTTTVSTSATTLVLNTARQSNAAFVLSGSEVTVQAGAGGDYRVSFVVTFDESDSNKRCVETWLEVNGSEPPAMRARGAHADADLDDTSGREGIVTLVAGDVLRVRSQVTNGSGGYTTLTGGASLMITTVGATGPAGPTGPTGSGSTITVEDDGVLVGGGPHDTLNFVAMVATDAGGGTADIKNVFGSDYQTEISTARSTTTSSSFQVKVTLTTPTLTGTYRIGWCSIIDQQGGADSVEARLQNTTDASTVGAIQRLEPKDTDNREFAGGFAEIVFAGAAKTFQIQWRQQEGNTAGIQDARIEIWRVS